MCSGGKIESNSIQSKLLSGIVLFAYIASFYIIYPIIGNAMLIVSIIPLLMVYCAFNLSLAFAVQIFLIVHRFFAIKVLGGSFEMMLSIEILLGTCLNFVILFTVNHLNKLKEKVKVVEKKLLLQNRELIITKNKAEESDRLKTTFISNISHEIRTPLNAVIGFSQLIMDPELKEDEKANFFDHIKKSGDRLMKQIDGFIEMSTLMAKQAPLDKTEFHLNQLIDELYLNSIEKIKNRKEVKLKKKIGLPDGRDIVSTDKVRLAQILGIIIDNGIKFTNQGFVKMSYEISDDNNLLFSVEDTGIGISPLYKHIIFDCFRQCGEEVYTRKFEGSGIGLAISKASVELLGGEIWYDSIVGKGTTFYFKIPYNPVFKRRTKLSRNVFNKN